MALLGKNAGDHDAVTRPHAIKEPIYRRTHLLFGRLGMNGNQREGQRRQSKNWCAHTDGQRYRCICVTYKDRAQQSALHTGGGFSEHIPVRRPHAPSTMSIPNHLSAQELRRYHRQLALKEVGLRGQSILKEASVLVVGAGGLGSPLALYLAAAGVGHLGLVDFDMVEESNLHRQVLHTTGDLGAPKVESARKKLQDLNTHIEIEALPVRLGTRNALDIIRRFDVVADGTDNFPSRYLINDACVLTGTPNVYGSVYQFEGQVSVFCLPSGPCYRCLYPIPPPPHLVPSCAEGGVIGVVPGIVGCLQASEVIKVLLGIGTNLSGRILLVNALEPSFRTLTVRQASHCALCGQTPTITSLIDYDKFCTINTVNVPEISVHALQQLRQQHAAPFVLDVRHAFEADISSLGADMVVPLPELSLRLADLDAHRQSFIVVHCRSGTRSKKAVQILQDAGFSRVASLAGGILAWSREVDESVTIC